MKRVRHFLCLACGALCLLAGFLVYHDSRSSSLTPGNGIGQQVTGSRTNHTEDPGDLTERSRLTPDGAVQTILFWNSWFKWPSYKFGIGSEPFVVRCGTDRCRSTTDTSEQVKAKVVVFFGATLNYSLRPVLPPRSDPEQLYAYLNTEPPAKYRTDLSGVGSDFNLTISYRPGSTIHWPYGTVLRKPDGSQTWTEPDIRKRNGTVAWMVSICGDANVRMTYYRQLAKHIPIDVYGKCGWLRCPERNRKTTECIQYLAARYKFYLAFENSHCLDYLTEKVFRTLQYDMIPVVMGAADYSRLLPPHSFIDVRDFESPRHLAEYLSYLDGNVQEYLKYFAWKKEFVVTEGIPDSGPVFCKLCDLISTGRKFVLDYDVSDWWQNGVCIQNRSELLNIYHLKDD